MAIEFTTQPVVPTGTAHLYFLKGINTETPLKLKINTKIAPQT